MNVSKNTLAFTLLGTLVCFLLVGIILSNKVLAQESSAQATSTSTTTEPLEVVESKPWYRSDKISGRVNMQDFVVGPGKVEIELAPGQSRTVEVSVTNRTSDDRKFKIEIEDAVGTTDSSQAVKLLGKTKGPYSIKDFVSIPEYELELDLGQRAFIPVTISIPPNADPGGYYGSVLVQTVQKGRDEELDGSVKPSSPIIARIGSLFFITVTGDTVREGGLEEFTISPDRLWHESGPFNFGILYENTGSLHLNPYGEISVTNFLGEEVGFSEIDPWFVLPQALRLREIEWDRELLLGRYTAHLQLNRGYDDIVDEATVTFWVLPWKFLVTVFGGLFVSVFLIRFFFKTFEFKRKRD